MSQNLFLCMENEDQLSYRSKKNKKINNSYNNKGFEDKHFLTFLVPFHYRSEVLQTTTKRTYHSLSSRAYAQSSLIEPIHSDLRSVIFIHLLAGNLGLSAWHKLNTSNTSELSQLSRICTKKKQSLKLLSKI